MNKGTSCIIRSLRSGFLILNLIIHVGRAAAQPFTEAFRLNPVQRDYHYFNFSDVARQDFFLKKSGSDTLPIPFFDDFSRPDLSWAPSRFWFGYAIRSILFLDGNAARAFGDQGISLRTDNRGGIWKRNANPPGPDFRSVCFVSPSIAWSCGSAGWLGYSADSGRTWTQVSSPSGNMRLDKVAFLSQDNGILIDSAGNLYRTANKGQSWISPEISTPNRFKARAVSFVNNNRVVAVGDSSRIAVSDNGGLSFNISTEAAGRSRHFRNVRFADGFMGFAIGDSGMVFKTISSGNFWSFIPLASNESLLDIAVDDTQKKFCWMVGTRGTLMQSRNSGNSWSKIQSGTTEDLLCIDLVNEIRGWIGTNGGRIHQVVFDEMRPYSGLWDPGSGIFVNNSFSNSPPSFGVATFDGLNAIGLPYSSIINKSGPCDTLTSACIDLQDLQSVPVFLSFYYQPASGLIEMIPDPEDSLVVQMQGKSGAWRSLWNVRGKGDEVKNIPFRYVSLTIPDSLKFSGSRFRFMNYGNQNGNFDLWHVDYVRMDTEHDAFDSLSQDYTISSNVRNLLKPWSALPLDQFRFAINNGISLFEESFQTMAKNLSPLPANLSGRFYLQRISPDSVQTLADLPPSAVSGLENPFNAGISSRILSVQSSAVQSLLRTNTYATFEYGVGLTPDPVANQYTGNDTLKTRFNVSTLMAYDDGSAELIRGVGGNGSIGVQKFFLYTADTLTDIQLFFGRTPENLQQNISFSLLVYDQLDFSDEAKPLIRRSFILPPADSVNKMITFSMRDDETLQKRILQGGREFYIGWEQGLIDNGNEVRIGCDINTITPNVFFFKTGDGWKPWTTDSYTLMLRPVFGPEFITSVKDRIGKPQSPFYPNPACSGFRSNQSFRQLQIRDITGKVRLEMSEGRPGIIIRPELPPGIYFLNWLEDGKTPVTQKMLIQ